MLGCGCLCDLFISFQRCEWYKGTHIYWHFIFYIFFASFLAPSAPANVTLDGTSFSINASWLYPTHPNGVIIRFHYEFYKTSNPSNKTTDRSLPSETDVVFDNLEFYTQYSFRVQAETEAGRGDWVDVVSRFTDPNGESFGTIF